MSDDILKKAMTQDRLTPDTVDAQFCSDWLKDQIKMLFEELKWRRAVAEVQIKKALAPAQTEKVMADCKACEFYGSECVACKDKRDPGWDSRKCDCPVCTAKAQAVGCPACGTPECRQAGTGTDPKV